MMARTLFITLSLVLLGLGFENNVSRAVQRDLNNVDVFFESNASACISNAWARDINALLPIDLPFRMFLILESINV